MTEQQAAESQRPPQPSQTPQPQVGQVVTVQNIYFNGFSLGLTNADLNMLLLLDGQPVGRLNMSFTTGVKTVVALLQDLIQKLKSVTGRDIMTTSQVEQGLKKLLPEGGKR